MFIYIALVLHAFGRYDLLVFVLSLVPLYVRLIFGVMSTVRRSSRLANKNGVKVSSPEDLAEQLGALSIHNRSESEGNEYTSTTSR